jgi:hypothetical protein
MTDANSQAHGLSMGALDWVLQQVKMPFQLQNLHTVNENLKWTMLLNHTKGIQIVLALFT